MHEHSQHLMRNLGIKAGSDSLDKDKLHLSIVFNRLVDGGDEFPQLLSKSRLVLGIYFFPGNKSVKVELFPLRVVVVEELLDQHLGCALGAS